MKRFPVQSWSAEQRRSIHCGCPFSGSAPLRVWCIQTCFQYRKTCTACNCAAQLRNWDTLLPGQSQPAKAPRRKHIARLIVDPASRECGDRTSLASSAAAAHCAPRHRSPCSPAVYTSCPLQNLFIGFGIGFEDPTCFHNKTIRSQSPARLSRFLDGTIPTHRGARLPGSNTEDFICRAQG